MIVKNKYDKIYELEGLTWDDSDGSWLVRLKRLPDVSEGDAGEDLVPLHVFTRHFTPYQGGEISGVICRECGNTLPPHSQKRHLDENDPIHACPHKEKI